MSDQNKPHRLNVPGPFYVLDGCCTACGVPETTAPELFAYDCSDHCYVKRQPSSDEELERAMFVMWGQELECVRYAGTDPNVLRRLAEAGCSSQCDHPLVGVEPVLRNIVMFRAQPTQSISLDPFVDYLRREWASPIRVKRHWWSRVPTSISWFENHFHEIDCALVDPSANRWKVRHGGPLGLSQSLHDWLKETPDIREIRWYSESELAAGADGKPRPW